MVKIKSFLIITVATILLLSTGLYLHDGYKETYFDYFLAAVIIFPLLFIIFDENKFKVQLIFSIIFQTAIILSAFLFWNYMDNNWPMIEDFDCDGPCYGLFSFENELQWQYLIFYSLAAILIGFLLKKIIMIARKKCLQL